MEFRYTVTIDDLVASNEHCVFSKRRRPVIIQALSGSACSFVIMVSLVYFTSQQIVATVSMGTAVAIAFGLLWVPFQRTQLRKSVKRVYAKNSDSAIGAVVMQVTDAHMHVSNATTSSSIEPQAIQKIVFTPNHCFIFLGPLKAITVPRRDLCEPALFVGVLTELVSPEKILGQWNNIA